MGEVTREVSVEAKEAVLVVAREASKAVAMVVITAVMVVLAVILTVVLTDPAVGSRLEHIIRVATRVMGTKIVFIYKVPTLI